MGASNIRRKTIFYKRAEFTQAAQKETLQSLLDAALKTNRFPLRRRMAQSGDEKTFQFINYNGKHGLNGDGPQNCLGAELFSYTEGADQSALEVQEGKEEIDVKSILPPNKNQEFLEGAVYFSVLGNHVIVMQSSALRVQDLERHLNWFLQNHSGVIEEGNGLVLVDAVPLMKKEEFNDAKSISITSPIQFSARSPLSPNGVGNGREESKSVKLSPKGLGWDALRSMVGDLFDLPNYLDADEILTSHELQLKWKRTPDADGSDLMASIARKLRHVTDELDYEIRTRSGKISRDDFKLAAPISIEWLEGRPRFDRLFPMMLEWLESLAENGRLEL